MKIVQTPPKTGEEFIVAWFDNGTPRTMQCRYNKEHELFEHKSTDFGWMSFAERFINAQCKIALVIIEE